MFKRMIFYIVIFVNSSSCMAQKDMIAKVENSDLKYLMTYLEISKIQNKTDQDKKFFIKIVEMPGKQKVLVDKEETISSAFYYVLVSSFDEASHKEAKLYKSEDFVLPRIVEVKESGDKQKFIIDLSIVPLPKKIKKFDGKVLLKENEINQRERINIQVEKY